MKNLFLLAAWLLLMPAALHAQLQKNNILLEGSFAYSRSTPKYSSISQPSGNPVLFPVDVVSQDLMISPLAGIFLTDRIVLSCGIIYSRTSQKEEGAFTTTNPSYGQRTTYTTIDNFAISNNTAPVLALRYFIPISDKFYFSPWLGAAYHFSRSKIETTYVQETRFPNDFGAPENSFIQGNEHKVSYSGNYLALDLSPQLVYFVNR